MFSSSLLPTFRPQCLATNLSRSFSPLFLPWFSGRWKCRCGQVSGGGWASTHHWKCHPLTSWNTAADAGTTTQLWQSGLLEAAGEWLQHSQGAVLLFFFLGEGMGMGINLNGNPFQNRIPGIPKHRDPNQQPKPLADGKDLSFCLCEPTSFPVCIRTSIPAYQALMVGLSIKSQGWRWAKIDCFDDQFEQKNNWIKESFAAVEDVGWRICRGVYVYKWGSDDHITCPWHRGKIQMALPQCRLKVSHASGAVECCILRMVG